MTRKPTLIDVANAADVSVATASRALAGKNRVSPATISRVRDAAASLGYRVDPIAKALREGSTRIVGMIVPVIGNPYYSRLVDAVEEALQQRGFELLLADSHGHLDEEVRRLRVFEERKVDGVVIVPSSQRESAGSLRALSEAVPVVQIDRSTAPPVADFVGVDNEAAMRLLLDHLVSRGATRIAYAGADDMTSAGVERHAAFQSESAALAITPSILHRGAFDVATGTAAADRLVASAGGASSVDAVIAGSDLIAFGLISRLRGLGVEVPRDLLVTGFDGTDMAQVFLPSLTTAIQPVAAIADEAIGFLQARIAGHASPLRRSRVFPDLVVGASTDRV